MKVNSPLAARPLSDEQEQAWASLTPRRLSVQTPVRPSPGAQLRPMVSMSDLLSRGSAPRFSILFLCAILSLGRNSHPSSASQAAESSPGNFPQLSRRPPPGRATDSSRFLHHLSGTSPTSPATPPHRWDPCLCPFAFLRWSKHHCFYGATCHSNQVFPQPKCSHLFASHKFLVRVSRQNARTDKTPSSITHRVKEANVLSKLSQWGTAMC